MKGRILAGLFLCPLFFVVGGDAQSPNILEKPVWTMELIKVEPENFALAMQYLDDHWMHVRAEAKRKGAVLDYHIISNAGMVSPGHQDSIVLLTKYKNMDAYLETRSAAVRYLAPDTQGFVPYGFLRLRSAEDPLNTQVFVEEPDSSRELLILPIKP